MTRKKKDNDNEKRKCRRYKKNIDENTDDEMETKEHRQISRRKYKQTKNNKHWKKKKIKKIEEKETTKAKQ